MLGIEKTVDFEKFKVSFRATWWSFIHDNHKLDLIRVASNRWLNIYKHQKRYTAGEAPEGVHTPVDPKATREAAGSLVVSLAPQERATLVLKEVFNFSLEEIAAMLSTSTGGVKSALHRARGRLRDEDQSGQQVAPPSVLNEFCSAFNARDLDRVVSLLLETVEVELSVTFADSGIEVAKRFFGGMMFATKMAMEAGISSEFRGNIQAVLDLIRKTGQFDSVVYAASI